MSGATPHWSAQPFETAELGLAVARLSDAEAAGPGDLARIAGEMRAAGIRLAHARVEEADAAAVRRLEDAGFRVVECLVTLGRPVPENASLPEGIGLARPDEAEACADLAGRTFSWDRFHADPAIADAAADRLKRSWILNSARGRADAMLVARGEGRILGFNACMRRDRAAVIDLIGVAPEARGRGLGRALVDGALAHYAGRADEILVGTQAKNTASLALYQAAGFRIRRSQLTLHLHLLPGAPS